MSADVIRIRNFYDQGSASLIVGRRHCCRCGGYARPDDVFVLLNLHGQWRLRLANDLDRKVLCSECADSALAARTTTTEE